MAIKRVITFIFLFFAMQSTYVSADTVVFRGEIQATQKIIVTLSVAMILPAPGAVKNDSHVITDDPSKPTALCEYVYSFTAPSVTVTLKVVDDKGQEALLGSTVAESTLKGTVYTDSPEVADVALCKGPEATKFPITGPLNVTLGALKNFQLPDGTLISFEPVQDTFKNEAVISLNNNESNSPILTGLKLLSVESIKWNTFGTDAPSKNGILTLLPSSK